MRRKMAARVSDKIKIGNKVAHEPGLCGVVVNFAERTFANNFFKRETQSFELRINLGFNEDKEMTTTARYP